MLRGEELIQLSTPRLVETETAVTLSTTSETTVLTAVGHASACDVWFKLPTAWESVVTLRLYARVADARVLLKTVRVDESHRSSAGGFVSGTAISVRGRPVTAFELTAQSSSAGVSNGQFMLNVWHSTESPLIIGGITSAAQQAAEERTVAHLALRNGTSPILAAGDASGRALIAGPGVGGTPSGGVLTVQGHGAAGVFTVQGSGAAGALANRPAGNDAVFTLTSPVIRLPVGAGGTFAVNLWHPSGSAKRVLIHRVILAFHGSTTGDVTIRGTRTTALGTGTAITAVALDQAEAATVSGAGPFTFAPTMDGPPKDYFSLAVRGDQRDTFVWEAGDWGKPIVLRASVAEGFGVRAIVESALGAVNNVSLTATIQFQEA